MANKFTMYGRVSARVHESDKQLLKDNNRTAREAVEYYNKVCSTTTGYLKVKEFFLQKEIDEMKYQLIAKEMELADIQKKLNDICIDNLSELRVKSYQKIIGLYGLDTPIDTGGGLKETFDEFIKGSYIQEMISKESILFPEVDQDEYERGLLDYFNNVIKIGMTN
ncbi:MAG: hypothetical protein J6P09_04745 [Methanobrevibacter sp.]|nr:hypothetical protein [Methanobrevibacter sp.]